MPPILFATGNQGKLAEAKRILGANDIQVISPQEYDLEHQADLTNLEIAETGQTLDANAQLKAQAFAHQAELDTFADDTGLMITALSDFPGVKSDRWTEGTPDQKNRALLVKMNDITNRQAKFVTVICFYSFNQARPYFFRGEVQGSISQEIRGIHGFGYDSVFIPQNYSQTFAELGDKVKDKISHRQRALVKLRDFLRSRED